MGYACGTRPNQYFERRYELTSAGGSYTFANRGAEQPVGTELEWGKPAVPAPSIHQPRQPCLAESRWFGDELWHGRHAEHPCGNLSHTGLAVSRREPPGV